VLQKLKNVVTVRAGPETGMTLVKINTADSLLLMALFPQMTVVDADDLIERRPFEQVSEAVAGQSWASGENSARLSVGSEGFIVRTDALFGRVRWREETLLTRTADGKTAVEQRERREWMN